MDKLELNFLFKDQNSGTGGCPAVYATNRSTHVIQGWNLPAGTELLNQAANETGVEVPDNIIDQIGERWARGHGLI